jgi:hypothetical protein
MAPEAARRCSKKKSTKKRREGEKKNDGDPSEGSSRIPYRRFVCISTRKKGHPVDIAPKEKATKRDV